MNKKLLEKPTAGQIQTPKRFLAPLPIDSVQIDDAYWNRYTRLIPEVVIPYQWRILNDQVPDAPPSHCLNNFRIAAGEAEGERLGTVFQDSDVAKWLEAVAYSLAQRPDEQLEKTADEVINLIGRAQGPDGYLNTYYTLVMPQDRWKNLTAGHELYCAGHFIEAAVAYYDATGKRRLLDTLCRFADLICEVFGPEEGQLKGYPGHPEIELALVRLYYATGQQRYLALAKHFVDIRGEGANYFLEEMARPGYHNIYPEFLPYDPSYSQSHLPVRMQNTAEGHAVRATYLYCAMADLAGIYDDKSLLGQCEVLWNNIVNKRMFITGSIGSSGLLERFTTDYDLTNDSNYSETCASIGLALFGLRMARLTRDASYIDTVERALYNTVRAGISLQGDRYFYVNPLEVWPDNCLPHTSRAHVKPIRQKWFDVACCPTNVARTFTALGNYIYSAGEQELFVNLYIQNKAHAMMGSSPVALELATDYPKTGKATLRMDAHNTEFTLNLRVPGFARAFTVWVNGELADGEQVKGFFRLRRVWNQDTIEIAFDIRPEIVHANPLVRANAGKLAIVRGPEVYCLEEVDNGPVLSSLYIRQDTELTESWEPDLFGGTTTIQCSGVRLGGWDTERSFDAAQVYTTEPVRLTAIPYGSWGNRKPGEMIVWVHALL